MRRRLASTSAALLLVVHSAAADGVQLAGPGSASAPAPQVVEDASWKLCEVTASLLSTSPGKSLASDARRQYLYLGESMEIESDVTIAVPGGTAMVHARARLRAAAATEHGVSYFVSSEGTLRSTLGFRHEQTGQDQLRSELVEIGDAGTRLHEIFALPDLGLRVVMVLRASPAHEREEPSLRERAGIADTVGTLRRFRVEALLKQGDVFQPLEQAMLQSMDGREAGLSLSRFSSEGAGGRPVGMPGAPAVKPVEVPRVATTRAAEMRAVASVPADGRFQKDVENLERAMRMDPTVDLGVKLPGQYDAPPQARKMSARKRAKLQRLMVNKEAHDAAVESSRRLPADDAAQAPSGLQREQLQLTLTPLRSTPDSLQLQIALRGHVKLPGETAFTSVDASTVEQVRFGESFELGLAEWVRQDAPLYDYVLRITPEP